jgi:hypothetical protein
MNSLCAGGLRRDAGREQMSLLADNFRPCANETAGRLCLVTCHVRSAIIHGCFSYPGLAHHYGEIAVQGSVQCSLPALFGAFIDRKSNIELLDFNQAH